MTTKLEGSNTKYLIALRYNKSIPSIPPLLANGSLISDYRKKANLFSETNTRVNSFRFTSKDILSIIKSLDSRYLHGYDNVSKTS